MNRYEYRSTSTRFLAPHDYDALSRVSASVQNCRTSGNVALATGCAAFDPDTPDRNVPTETHYDALGRAFETVDALGYVTHTDTDYDGLGRTIARIVNYDDGVVGANEPADVGSSQGAFEVAIIPLLWALRCQ